MSSSVFLYIMNTYMLFILNKEGNYEEVDSDNDYDTLKQRAKDNYSDVKYYIAAIRFSHYPFNPEVKVDA